jgi:hypothetical protein
MVESSRVEDEGNFSNAVTERVGNFYSCLSVLVEGVGNFSLHAEGRIGKGGVGFDAGLGLWIDAADDD